MSNDGPEGEPAVAESWTDDDLVTPSPPPGSTLPCPEADSAMTAAAAAAAARGAPVSRRRRDEGQTDTDLDADDEAYPSAGRNSVAKGKRLMPPAADAKAGPSSRKRPTYIVVDSDEEQPRPKKVPNPERKQDVAGYVRPLELVTGNDTTTASGITSRQSSLPTAQDIAQSSDRDQSAMLDDDSSSLSSAEESPSCTKEVLRSHSGNGSSRDTHSTPRGSHGTRGDDECLKKTVTVYEEGLGYIEVPADERSSRRARKRDSYNEALLFADLDEGLKKSQVRTKKGEGTGKRDKAPIPKPDEFKIVVYHGRTWARQTRTCLAYRFPPGSGYLCRQCVTKRTYEICRFANLRAFAVDAETEQVIGFKNGTFTGEPEVTFLSIADADEQPILPSHEDLNRPMDFESQRQTMITAATALRDVLSEGLKHAQQDGCVRRQRELQIRAMCDFCSTGLFASSYMCSRCGLEYCCECASTMDEVNVGEKGARGMHWLRTCIKHPTKPPIHSSSELLPMTRFSCDELSTELTAMDDLLMKARKQSKEADHVRQIIAPQASKEASFGDGDVPSQFLDIVSAKDLDEKRFLATWSKGEPIVIADVSTPHRWDAEAMVEKYGDDVCEITRCDVQLPPMSEGAFATFRRTKPVQFAKHIKSVQVKKFFETFGQTNEVRREVLGKGIWKLKDWPPSAEFRESFPELYDDFNAAVPMPDYTRRDGSKNISSLFPKNANGPDLGPKMYNAWPGEHSKGKKGTTRLHMDIADAVNIMLYTAPPVDEEKRESDRCALWHIFRAQDANAIRSFLREAIPDAGESLDDPIHTQLYYLDDDLLRRLYEVKGVFPWTIRQRQHEAVFIPAGCAHQVVNLTDCIKVAVDFISPQNVRRCFTLTHEFRALRGDTLAPTNVRTNPSPDPPASTSSSVLETKTTAVPTSGKKSWREDVLQLRAQLWYAWRACRLLGETDGG